MSTSPRCLRCRSRGRLGARPRTVRAQRARPVPPGAQTGCSHFRSLQEPIPSVLPPTVKSSPNGSSCTTSRKHLGRLELQECRQRPGAGLTEYCLKVFDDGCFIDGVRYTSDGERSEV